MTPQRAVAEHHMCHSRLARHVIYVFSAVCDTVTKYDRQSCHLAVIIYWCRNVAVRLEVRSEFFCLAYS